MSDITDTELTEIEAYWAAPAGVAGTDLDYPGAIPLAQKNIERLVAALRSERTQKRERAKSHDEELRTAAETICSAPLDRPCGECLAIAEAVLAASGLIEACDRAEKEARAGATLVVAKSAELERERTQNRERGEALANLVERIDRGADATSERSEVTASILNDLRLTVEFLAARAALSTQPAMDDAACDRCGGHGHIHPNRLNASRARRDQPGPRADKRSTRERVEDLVTEPCPKCGGTGTSAALYTGGI